MHLEEVERAEQEYRFWQENAHYWRKECTRNRKLHNNRLSMNAAIEADASLANAIGWAAR